MSQRNSLIDTVVAGAVLILISWFAPRWVSVPVMIAVAIGYFVWIGQSRAAEAERKRLHDEMWPRYRQDLDRTREMMTEEQRRDYAEKHYKRIIGEYRKRGATSDPYWNRAARPLDAGYVRWIQAHDPKGAERIRTWYTEPEILYNLALQVRSTKMPAREETEWKLEKEEIPKRNVVDFRIRNTDALDREDG